MQDDVIVVMVKNDFDFGQIVVIKVIMKEGGDSIQVEIRINYFNGIIVGNFVIVSLGKLDCKEIYIGILLIYKEDVNVVVKVCMKIV